MATHPGDGLTFPRRLRLELMKKILIGVAVVAALFGAGYMLPAEQLVGRSVAVNAPPEAIYSHVDSPRSWTWSPWSAAKLPGARIRYEGPQTGVGAQVVWQDETMGDGRLSLAKADPLRGVTYEMSLNRDPYTASGGLQFVPGDSSTLVVWTWRARYSDPVARLMGIIAGEQLGAQLEQGLLELKKIAEASAPAVPTPSPPVPAEPAAEVAATPVDAPPEPVDPPAVPEPKRQEEEVAESAPASPPPQEPVATPGEP